MDNSACDFQTSKMRTKSPELFSSGTKKHSKSATASDSDFEFEVNATTATSDSQPASTALAGIVSPTAPIIDELIGSKPTNSTPAASESASVATSGSASWQDRLVGFVGFVWIVFVSAIMLM